MKFHAHKLTCTVGFVLLTSFALLAADAPAYPPKKVLFFSKSSGFEHGVVKRYDGKPSFAERLLEKFGAKHQIEFVFSKDGSNFSKEYLAQFDAFCFFATGDLTTEGDDHNPPMSPEGKQALLDAVSSGKGFVGIHSGADAFHGYETRDMGPKRWTQDYPNADPFIKMVGGEFLAHDKEATAPLIVADPKFPGISAIPKDWTLHEEWYTYKHYAPDLHVILVQDTAAIPQPSYARPNYPETWARMQGKGRVFYTSLGHRNDVWENPVFESILMGGMDWALGRVSADVTPNIETVTPGANQLPEIYEKRAKH